MPVIDEELEKVHTKEERKLRFGEFVAAQKAAGKPGEDNACLQTEGFRDFYGKAIFARGMHSEHWILPADQNGKALLFKDKKKAAAYAKELQTILREKGYPASRAWAEQVSVRTTTPYPYSKLRAPKVSFEAEERFLIRMRVR